jgi:hypothetical protein
VRAVLDHFAPGEVADRHRRDDRNRNQNIGSFLLFGLVGFPRAFREGTKLVFFQVMSFSSFHVG